MSSARGWLMAVTGRTTMAKYAGIDLSYSQEKVDYKALAKAKIMRKPLKFVMIRLGHGRKKDTLFEQHYKGCKAAGIKVGIYHWSYAKSASEARVEANWVLEQLRGLEIDYPIAMDFEDKGVLAAGLSREEYTDLSTIQAANYYPLLYTGKYTIRDHLDSGLLKEFDLWLAQYTSEGYQAQLGQVMWQFTVAGHPEWDYSKQGSVAGVTGPCDCDWAYVGYAAKIKKLKMNQPLVAVRAEKLVRSSEVDSEKALLRSKGYTLL